MNFKHSAFIENTPEMREWLEEIGIKPKFIAEVHYSDDCLVVKNGCYMEMPDRVVELYETSSIDCRNNPNLFKAITAILTTTDIGKHYINNHTGQWRRCDYTMATDESIDWSDWEEATLKELIKHFKK